MSTTTKKISTKKVMQFIIMTLLIAVFAVALAASSSKQSHTKISDIHVTLKNQGNEENFLLAKDVEQLFITNQQINIKEKSIATLDLNEIERIAENNPWVKSAEVYVDNINRLNIEVTQRLPVARIFTTGAKSFYIDTAGFEMPLSERYAYPVAVFTNLSAPNNDSVYFGLKKQIVYMSQLLQADSFWNNQVAQIDLTPSGHFVLIPTIGKQKILFGDTSNASRKLANLYSFYKEVSNKIGWDKYETLDVRFKGQVVASPSLGWTPPKDDAIAVSDSSVVTATNVNPKPPQSAAPLASAAQQKAETTKKAVAKTQNTTEKKKTEVAKKATPAKSRQQQPLPKKEQQKTNQKKK